MVRGCRIEIDTALGGPDRMSTGFAPADFGVDRVGRVDVHCGQGRSQAPFHLDAEGIS